MESQTQALASAVLKLTPEQRWELLDTIWESLAPTPGLTLSDAQLRELKRRHEEYLADPSIAIPWEDAREAIRAEIALRRQARV